MSEAQNALTPEQDVTVRRGGIVFDGADVHSVALCAWKEAAGEGLTGCEAVMCVIRNRARDWNKSVHDVVYGKNQFSSMSVPTDGQFNKEPSAYDSVFKECLNLAWPVLGAEIPDITAGAHYYWNPVNASSEWFAKHIAGDPVAHPRTVQLRHHLFYV